MTELEAIDRYLAVLRERLPTAQELFELCDALKILVVIRGNDVRLFPADDGDFEACKFLKTLFRSEPFRSQAIAAATRRS